MRSVDIVRAFYGALGRGDVPAAVSLLASEIEWTEAERFPYFAGTWRTPQAVVDGLLSQLNRDWLDFSAGAKTYVADGELVVAFGDYAGTNRVTGRSITAPFAHLWTVRRGKIVAFVQYTDTAKVLEAVPKTSGDR